MVDSSQENLVRTTVVDFNVERQLRIDRNNHANIPENDDGSSHLSNKEVIENGVRLNRAFMQLKDPRDMENAIAYVEALVLKSPL